MSPAGASPTGGSRLASPSSAVHIDRLSLRVAGLDEEAARAFARLVAEGLAAGVVRGPAIAGLDRLRVEVEADAADAGKPDLLARRTVDAIGRVLARDRISGGPDGEAVR